MDTRKQKQVVFVNRVQSDRLYGTLNDTSVQQKTQFTIGKETRGYYTGKRSPKADKASIIMSGNGEHIDFPMSGIHTIVESDSEKETEYTLSDMVHEYDLRPTHEVGGYYRIKIPSASVKSMDARIASDDTHWYLFNNETKQREMLDDDDEVLSSVVVKIEDVEIPALAKNNGLMQNIFNACEFVFNDNIPVSFESDDSGMFIRLDESNYVDDEANDETVEQTYWTEPYKFEYTQEQRDGSIYGLSHVFWVITSMTFHIPASKVKQLHLKELAIKLGDNTERYEPITDETGEDLNTEETEDTEEVEDEKDSIPYDCLVPDMEVSFTDAQGNEYCLIDETYEELQCPYVNDFSYVWTNEIEPLNVLNNATDVEEDLYGAYNVTDEDGLMLFHNTNTHVGQVHTLRNGDVFRITEKSRKITSVNAETGVEKAEWYEVFVDGETEPLWAKASLFVPKQSETDQETESVSPNDPAYGSKMAVMKNTPFVDRLAIHILRDEENNEIGYEKVIVVSAIWTVGAGNDLPFNHMIEAYRYIPYKKSDDTRMEYEGEDEYGNPIYGLLGGEDVDTSDLMDEVSAFAFKTATPNDLCGVCFEDYEQYTDEDISEDETKGVPVHVDELYKHEDEREFGVVNNDEDGTYEIFPMNTVTQIIAPVIARMAYGKLGNNDERIVVLREVGMAYGSGYLYTRYNGKAFPEWHEEIVFLSDVDDENALPEYLRMRIVSKEPVLSVKAVKSCCSRIKEGQAYYLDGYFKELYEENALRDESHKLYETEDLSSPMMDDQGSPLLFKVREHFMGVLDGYDETLASDKLLSDNVAIMKPIPEGTPISMFNESPIDIPDDENVVEYYEYQSYSVNNGGILVTEKEGMRNEYFVLRFDTEEEEDEEP